MTKDGPQKHVEAEPMPSDRMRGARRAVAISNAMAYKHLNLASPTEGMELCLLRVIRHLITHLWGHHFSKRRRRRSIVYLDGSRLGRSCSVLQVVQQRLRATSWRE